MFTVNVFLKRGARVYIYPELGEVLLSAQKALEAGDFEAAREKLNRSKALNAKIWRRQARLDRFTNVDWAEQQGVTPETSSQFLEVTHHVRKSWASIAHWLDTFILSVGRQELLASSEGVDILLDRYLPFHWDVNQDIVILSGSHSEAFVNALASRGQRQIVVVEDTSGDGETLEARPPVSKIKNYENSDTTTVVISVKGHEVLSVKQLAALRDIEPPGFVSIPTDMSGEQFDGFEALKNQMNARFIQQSSQRFWPTIFAHQIIRNLPHIYDMKSICDVRSDFDGKHAMIVSPGPSLLDSVRDIKAYRENFVLVSLIRSLPVLFDHGIIPDYVMLVDAQDHTSEKLNLIPDDPLLSAVPLIISEFAHRSSYEAAFKDFYILPSAGLRGSPVSIAIHGIDPPIVNGGSVATQATVMCAELGASSVTLVGQDLSVSDSGEAYASKSQRAMKTAEHVTCLGINGEQLRTQTDYKHFAREFEIIGANYARREVKLLNCTTHGAFLHNWTHIPLSADHPAVSDEAGKECSPQIRELVQVESSGTSKSTTAMLDAIGRELFQLEEILVLLLPIKTELTSLLAKRSDDTSFLEALEHELLQALTVKGSWTRFYTNPAKLEAGVSLESNQNLQENLIVSLDYYLAIEAGARRLKTLFTEAQSVIEQQQQQ